MIPVLVVYGFFFMASYPMTEAALMESVPDAVRGRVFGLFVMGGGVIGNLSHWAVGVKVKQLGEAAHSVNAYFTTYTVVAFLMLASLAGLICLHAIQRREGPVAPKAAKADSMPLLT
jgi:MFS family permease